MRTIEKTPKAKATTTIKIPKAALRLAYQLGTTPEVIMNRALRIGINSIDFCLSEDADPFAVEFKRGEFYLTHAMNSLSPQLFAELCDGEEEPQKVLAEEELARRHLEWKAEKAAEDFIIPFYAPPRDIG